MHPKSRNFVPDTSGARLWVESAARVGRRELALEVGVMSVITKVKMSDQLYRSQYTFSLSFKSSSIQRDQRVTYRCTADGSQ